MEANDDHQVLQHFFARGGSLRMLVDVEAEDLDAVYAYACQLYDAGEFGAAKRFFFMLARVDHWQFDYWLALGLCSQKLGEHEEAVFCFSRSGLIRAADPRSSYFAGVSYQLLGRRDYARKAFNAALKWCGQQGAHEPIRRLAAQSLAHCVAGV